MPVPVNKTQNKHFHYHVEVMLDLEHPVVNKDHHSMDSNLYLLKQGSDISKMILHGFGDVVVNKMATQ